MHTGLISGINYKADLDTFHETFSNDYDNLPIIVNGHLCANIGSSVVTAGPGFTCREILVRLMKSYSHVADNTRYSMPFFYYTVNSMSHSSEEIASLAKIYTNSNCIISHNKVNQYSYILVSGKFSGSDSVIPSLIVLLSRHYPMFEDVERTEDAIFDKVLEGFLDGGFDPFLCLFLAIYSKTNRLLLLQSTAPVERYNGPSSLMYNNFSIDALINMVRFDARATSSQSIKRVYKLTEHKDYINHRLNQINGGYPGINEFRKLLERGKHFEEKTNERS